MIKNAFKQEPVTIEDQHQETSENEQIDEKFEPEQEQIDSFADEIDDCLELKEAFKNHEISKEEQE